MLQRHFKAYIQWAVCNDLINSENIRISPGYLYLIYLIYRINLYLFIYPSMDHISAIMVAINFAPAWKYSNANSWVTLLVYIYILFAGTCIISESYSRRPPTVSYRMQNNKDTKTNKWKKSHWRCGRFGCLCASAYPETLLPLDVGNATL